MPVALKSKGTKLKWVVIASYSVSLFVAFLYVAKFFYRGSMERAGYFESLVVPVDFLRLANHIELPAGESTYDPASLDRTLVLNYSITHIPQAQVWENLENLRSIEKLNLTSSTQGDWGASLTYENADWRVVAIRSEPGNLEVIISKKQYGR